MKKKGLVAVLCMVMATSIMNTGCSDNTVKSEKKEKTHTTEKKTVKNKNTDKKVSVSSSEKPKEETKYEYGITNLKSVEYIKDPSIPEVGEDGNPMNVPKEILGYYTNGNIGYDFRKIDGEYIAGDVIEFGYRTRTFSANIMDVTSEGVVINFLDTMDESADILLTTDGFTVDNTNKVTTSKLEWMDYCYYLIPYNRGYSEDLTADTFKNYQLGDYVRADYPETVYNLTYNEAECYNAESTDSDEEIYNELTEKTEKILDTNTQPLTNRRDRDKYIKHIKYIPTEEYYIKGNPSKQEPLLIMKVSTGKDVCHKQSWSAGDVNEGKAGTFDSTYAITEDEKAQEEANQYWESGGSSNDEYINSEYDIGINLCGFVNVNGKYITDGVYNPMIYAVSLNYDVPELVGLTWKNDEALTQMEGTMKEKSYSNYFKLDVSDIENGNITMESNFYNETVIYKHKNENQTDLLSETLFDGTKENKATLHAISEEKLKEIGIDMTNIEASIPE